MASEDSAFLGELYQNWTDRMAGEPNMPISGLRAMFDEWGKPTREPSGVTYRSDTLGGVDAIWAEPMQTGSARLIVYTHGGGFAVGSADSHRKLAGHLAKSLHARAVVLDYRRAPEHPFPAQVEDVVAVYRALTGSGQAAGELVMAGDSAGGNLAVGATLKLRELGLPLPGAVLAFSPWLDMELGGETLDINAGTDRLVGRPILQAMAGMFLGSTAPTDPIANPLRNDFTGFPPLYINAGGAETLRSDAEALHARAAAAGVRTELSVVPDMQHVFVCLAGRASEADDELRRIASWMENLS